MTEAITCARFFDGIEMHGPSLLMLSDGIVRSIEPFEGAPEHHLVCPGFVDLQMNGFDDVDCADHSVDNLRRLDTRLAGVGTTSYLATLITDELGAMSERVERIADAGLHGCAGVHLEGPFLGSAPGAHPRSRIIEPDVQWLQSLPSIVRLVTLGVESPGALDAIRSLRTRGTVVSLGHTRPTRDQWDSSVDAGARMVTHLFNAMSGIHHRDFGMVLAALTDDRVLTGLIADMHHVNPEAVALAFSAKPTGVCLVSDSIAWRASWAVRAGVRLVGGVPTLGDGTLAGSATPLAECVRNAVMACGVELSTALRSATSLPASIIDRNDIGHVRAGESCDVVACDRSLGVVQTWRRLQSPRGFQTDI
jgi:N-acetylglucosamine-6-phosphate deacetylase